MMRGQAKLVLKSVVPGWYELLATLRQERIMEKLKNQNLRYRDEYDESVIQLTSSIPAAAAPHPE